MEGEIPKVDEVKNVEIKEDNTSLKLGASTDVKSEASTIPPAKMGKLEFKDLPLDMKRMILSYVRRKFLYSLDAGLLYPSDPSKF